MRVIMHKKSDHNACVRFDSKDKNPVIKNIYVNRTMPGIDEAQAIAVEITIGTAAPAPAAPATAMSDDALASLVGT